MSKLNEEYKRLRAVMVSPHITDDQVRDMARENVLLTDNVELRARVAELEHSLSDAMEQLEAIQGTNQVHIDRVAKLEFELKSRGVVIKSLPDQGGEGDENS